MNLRPKDKFTPEVYTGSLNDIMFFLLLFFLIMSTLVNPSVIKLMLPKATTYQTLAKQQITISVTDKKEYYLDKDKVAFEQLQSELEKKIQNIQEPTVVLRVDNSLTVQDLVDVLQIGNKLKIKMVLATKSMQK